MKYFEINDDINFPNRWYLGDVSEVDNWELSTSVPENNDNLQVEVVRDGEEMDFTFTEAYGVPVVSLKVREALHSIKGISFIPVKVRGKKCSTEYFILVTTEIVECVDEASSEFKKFEMNDPVRPDKAGEFRSFFCLKLDKNKAEGFNIFRVKRFEVAVIISDEAKAKLEAIEATGLKFSIVT